MELTFTEKSFERKFFSDETNRSFVKCFLEHVRKDPLTAEPGKSILFAVNRKHATKLVQILNEEAAKKWPEVYGAGSDFAVQVTSDIPGAQQMTLDFANNNLNGKSKWKKAEFPDYNTNRTRVCVTVGMMTTGYDCQDLLNVGLVRPIFSPTDFIQIKGRGTRLFEFEFADKKAAKSGFGLFDFFANCEYFEEEFNYDEELKLPKPGTRGDDDDGNDGGGGVVPPLITDTHTHTGADQMMGVQEIAVGPDGMRIDREMFRARERFARQTMDLLQQVPELKEAMELETWPYWKHRCGRGCLTSPRSIGIWRNCRNCIGQRTESRHYGRSCRWYCISFIRFRIGMNWQRRLLRSSGQRRSLWPQN